MAVRSKRLWDVATVGAGHSTLYTAPAGETALLKQLTLVNASALANLFTLKLNGTSGADSIMAIVVPAQGGELVSGLFVVLQPGDILRAVAGAASIFCAGFGAELEGVAD